MPDIRYVCLSDMHLGAETSLLTNLKESVGGKIDPSRPSPVLEQLVACLRELISNNTDQSEKPTLVLNGDILELALTQERYAAMCFERFIDLAMPKENPLFDRIIFNPGNHDHHLWETARETQYVSNYLKHTPWGDDLEDPWHTTNVFNLKNPVPSYYLNGLIHRKAHLKDMDIETTYPNYGVISPDRRKCVVFHHGHFTESIYTLMSKLRTMVFPKTVMPTDIWELEGENFAWIDFLWSALGRSEGVGKSLDLIYEKLQNEKQLDILLKNFSKSLAKDFALPGLGSHLDAKLLYWALSAIADKVGGMERHKSEGVLSDDAKAGLKTYMETPLRKQILVDCDNTMPSNVTFVFGHTHKPFQDYMTFAGYLRKIKVYNSGGWVVDRVDRDSLYGGALILIDEALDAISLRMYNESKNVNDYKVKVEDTGGHGVQPGPFLARIKTLVGRSPALWETFSRTTANEVDIRAAELQKRIIRSGL